MFALAEEQRAVADLARKFADSEIAPFALGWDERKELPADTLKRAAELGMASIYVKEDVGGSGLSRMDSVLIFEGLATGCPTIAGFLSIHNMVSWMIDTYGDAEQRAQWLPRLTRMDLVASYCLTEPGAGSDAAALVTKAERDGDEYVLNGVKQFISGAGFSDLYLVMARTSDNRSRGISTFIVEKGTPGLSFGVAESKMGWNAQPTRQVVLEDVRIPVSQRIGPEGAGFKIAMQGLNGGRLNIAACSLGGAQAAYEKTLRYMKDRKAFGSKLTSFQALQFTLAEMATGLEAARLMLWQAADALDRKDPRAVQLCAMAKKFVTDTGFEVANKALQLHGGYGYLREYGVEKIVRDLRVHQILEGTNEIMNVIIARSITA
ncbi:acyl-CoA dehydrogenase [Nakamurella silvestris]|nr:acyl-CoA dehydrogenase [Nakamurella silvestris]